MYSYYLGKNIIKDKIRLQKTTKVSTLSTSEEIDCAKSERKWTRAMCVEDLPLGARKKIRIDCRSVLLFWYKKKVYAIDPRSPAEGAYSEGFTKASFTQNNCIRCPSTGTLFSLESGEVVDWYPNNPVLRILTPKNLCSPMLLYSVQIDKGIILVDLTIGCAINNTDGGLGTSLESSNVYSIEPKVYIEGRGLDDLLDNDFFKGKNSTDNKSVYVFSFFVIGLITTSGTAIFLYYENFTSLIIFWILCFSAFAAFVYSTNTSK